MVIAEAAQATQELGGRPIFSSVSFTITAGERVGIVGRNGAGKTTLLKLLAGLDSPVAGAVRLNSRITVGYLEQLSMAERPPRGRAPSSPPGEEKTVFDTAAEGLAHLLQQEEHLRALEREIEGLSAAAGGPQSGQPHDAELERLLHRYEQTAAAFERAGGYAGPARIRSFLFGLGFGEEHMDRPVNTLSGGQQARVYMARLLASSPDFMLLDEPTNHLDLASLEWLEGFLAKYDGTLAVVSHDRAFLDAVATRIIEIEDGLVHDYPGNYSFYLEEKRRRRESSAARMRRLEGEKQRLEEFIRRFGAGTRARQARDRLKKLRRLEEELDEERAAGQAGPAEDAAARGELRFDPVASSYAEVLAIEDLGHGYGPADARGAAGQNDGKIDLVFDGLTGLVRRGDRVALVGPNGSGKSTFLKILAGHIRPTRGVMEFGRRVKIGYFAQDLGHLNADNTVLQELTSLGIDEVRGRALLARFLFRGDEVFNEVKNLSGGEKTRLALAQLIVSGANVLLLDEPTNHLDLAGREALGEALETFPGTIIFASHDRYLLRQTATAIWAFTGCGRVKVIDGGYDDYVEMLRNTAGKAVAPGPDSHGTEASETPKDPQEDKGARDGQPLPPWEVRRLQQEMEDLEARITALEKEKSHLSRQLADPDTFRQGGGGEVVTRFRRVEELLAEYMDRWETVAHLLD